MECFLAKVFPISLKNVLFKMNSTAVSFVSFSSYHSLFLFEAKLETDFHDQFPSETLFLFHTLKFTRNMPNFPTTACRALDPMVMGAGRCAYKTSEHWFGSAGDRAVTS